MKRSAPDSNIYRAADFSICRTWRYTLRRYWDEGRPRLLMVLLNPSVADEFQDDPTNVRGISFAADYGYGSLVFCNLFAVRNSKPAIMKMAAEPIGPDNDQWLLAEAKAADRIVVAWGIHGSFMRRDRQVLTLLKDLKLYCFGRTKHGFPKHPLYLKKSTRLERF